MKDAIIEIGVAVAKAITWVLFFCTSMAIMALMYKTAAWIWRAIV